MGDLVMWEYTQEQLREIDQLIAEHVMGHEIHIHQLGWPAVNKLIRELKVTDGKVVLTRELVHYSTDIAAAWHLVEKLASNKQDFRIDLDTVSGTYCAFFSTEGYREMYSEEATTAPLAISLAALRLVGIDTAEILDK